VETDSQTTTFWAQNLHYARLKQMMRFAQRVHQIAVEAKLGIMVLGKTYKPGVPYMEGSPANLLFHYLDDMSKLTTLDQWDIVIDGPRVFAYPWVFVIGTPHPEYAIMKLFPVGSIVIDPWGYIPMSHEGVTYIYPARGGNLGQL